MRLVSGACYRRQGLFVGVSGSFFSRVKQNNPAFQMVSKLRLVTIRNDFH